VGGGWRGISPRQRFYIEFGREGGREKAKCKNLIGTMFRAQMPKQVFFALKNVVGLMWVTGVVAQNALKVTYGHLPFKQISWENPEAPLRVWRLPLRGRVGGCYFVTMGGKWKLMGRLLCGKERVEGKGRKIGQIRKENVGGGGTGRGLKRRGKRVPLRVEEEAARQISIVGLHLCLTLTNNYFKLLI